MTDHKAAKEWVKQTIERNKTMPTSMPDAWDNLAACYLELTAQLAAKDAVIGELVSTLEFYADPRIYIDEVEVQVGTTDSGYFYKCVEIVHTDSGERAALALAKYRDSADKGE